MTVVLTVSLHLRYVADCRCCIFFPVKQLQVVPLSVLTSFLNNELRLKSEKDDLDLSSACPDIENYYVVHRKRILERNARAQIDTCLPTMRIPNKHFPAAGCRAYVVRKNFSVWSQQNR